MPFAIGIDLGTTNSCAFVYQENNLNVIHLGSQKLRTLPSCVLYDNDNSEIVVGKSAESRATGGRHPVIFDTKRIIGRKFDDYSIAQNQPHWPFLVKPGPENECQIEIKHRNKSLSILSPEEVSAELLKRIKFDAEEQLGEEVKNAVITVPAYFTDAQRRATIKAANLAELNVLELINEPTAAALAFAYQKDHSDRLVLVYDLGGGTFDVSLVRFKGGEGKVIAKNGHSNLGGRDFDNNLANYVVQEKSNYSLAQNHIVEKSQRNVMKRLKLHCKEVKERLSEKTSEDFVLDNFSNGEDLEFTITREKFEDINVELFKKSIQILDRTVTEAKVDKNEIDDVLLVGGSTRIPKVRKLLAEFFNGKSLSRGVNPDEAVAMGAALKAAELSGTYGEKIELVSMKDITSFSLGISDYMKRMRVVVPRNAAYPSSFTKPFETAYDYQTSIKITIFEGEDKVAEKNRRLGQFTVSGAKSLPKGQVKINVKFSIDSNSILTVTATESSNQNTNSVLCDLKLS